MLTRTRQILAFLVLAALFAASAGAEDLWPIETDEAIVAQPFLTLSHHGYFRLRADLFFKADLGNGTSGFRAPVHKTAANAGLGEDGNTSMGANMRFRWQPELKIGQRLRIMTTVDIMDNVVLGSTPDFSRVRPDVPLVFLSDSQADFSDAIRVKEVYGEWDILNAFLLRVGRMADPFGLGIVSNGGSGLDSDFGDYVDRVTLRVSAFGFHSWLFFDSPGEGPTSQNSFEPYGQPRDLDSADDVIRWGFTLGYTPIGRAAEAKRRKDLGSGKAVYDVIVKNSFTTQTIHAEVPDVTLTCPESSPLERSFDCQTLRDRDMNTWVGDLWFRLLWKPRFDMTFRTELEVAGIYGSVGAVQNQPGLDSAKDFFGLGGVLQMELEHRKLTYGVEVGFATGDDIAFGPYGPGYTLPDDAAYAADPARQNNKTVSSFLFDRDYHVDLLLFREVVGAVANAFYVKPSVQALLFSSGEDRIGGKLSVLYGHALNADSTPGREAPMGVETDLNIFYEAVGVARAELEAGILVPLSAFNAGLGGRAPELSFALQARISMSF